jgi:hypothetical protein
MLMKNEVFWESFAVSIGKYWVIQKSHYPKLKIYECSLLVHRNCANSFPEVLCGPSVDSIGFCNP